jgi:hypothetical protein
MRGCEGPSFCPMLGGREVRKASASLHSPLLNTGQFNSNYLMSIHPKAKNIL